MKTTMSTTSAERSPRCSDNGGTSTQHKKKAHHLFLPKQRRFQKVDTHRGPPASYKNLHKPLPEPPKGMEWVLDDENKEWRLEALPDHDILADAGIIDENDPYNNNINKNNSNHNGRTNPTTTTTTTTDPEFFLEHVVQPNEKLVEICQMYKLTPSELKQANPNIGSILSSSISSSSQQQQQQPTVVPPPPDPNHHHHQMMVLRIPYRPSGTPIIEKSIQAIQLYPVPTPDDKINHICHTYKDMNEMEAKCYLELNDWDLTLSLKNAQEDGFLMSKNKKE